MSDFSHQTVTFIRGVTFVSFVFDLPLLPGAVLGSGIAAPCTLMEGPSWEGGTVLITIVQMRKPRPKVTEQGRCGAGISIQTAWLVVVGKPAELLPPLAPPPRAPPPPPLAAAQGLEKGCGEQICAGAHLSVGVWVGPSGTVWMWGAQSLAEPVSVGCGPSTLGLRTCGLAGECAHTPRGCLSF